MKKQVLGLVLMANLLLALTLPAFSADAPITLKYHFQPDDAFTVYFVKHSQIHYETAKGDEDSDTETETKRNFMVQKVYPDGKAEVAVTCEYILIKTLDAEGHVLNVTDSRGEDPSEKAAASLVSHPLVLTITPAGEVSDIQGIQEATDNFYNNTEAATQDKTERTVLEIIMKSIYGDQNVRETLNRFVFIPYPDHPVSIGDTWEHSHDMDNDMFHLSALLRFTLKEIMPQDNKIILTFEDIVKKTTSNSDIMVLKTNPDNKSFGTYEVSADTGYIRQADFRTQDVISSYHLVNGQETLIVTRRGDVEEKAYLAKAGEEPPKDFLISTVEVASAKRDTDEKIDAPKTLDDYGLQLRQSMDVYDLTKANAVMDQILSKFDINKLEPEKKTAIEYYQSILYTKLGRYNEAQKAFDAYLPAMEKNPSPHFSGFLSNAKSLQIEAYLGENKPEKAEALLNSWLTQLEQHKQTSAKYKGEILHNLAYLYQQKHLYAKAEDLYKRSIKANLDAGNPPLDSAPTYGNLCQLELTTKHLSEAETHCKQAAMIYEKQLAPDHPNVGIVTNDLGRVYLSEGKKQEALKTFNKALTILEPAYQNMQHEYQPNNPDMIKIKSTITELKQQKSKL